MAYSYLSTRLRALRPAALVFTALLIGVPVAAQATTVCESGRILQMQFAAGGGFADDGGYSGGGPALYIRTEHQTGADSLRATNYFGRRSTKIYKHNVWHDIRWADRLSLLRMAYVLQQPINITANNSSCQGVTDEFTITLCRTGDSC
ncbi:hypothetical protein ACVW0Y_002296 [Pseudomonas sp. TE3786]